VVMKDGHEMPIQAAIQAIGRPLQNAAMSGDTGSMPSAAPAPSGGGGMGSPMPTRTPTSTYPSSGSQTPGSTEDKSGSSVAPLGPTSQGVVGMKGLSLQATGQASVISAENANVHLDGGTQMILKTM